MSANFFFDRQLSESDVLVWQAIQDEHQRQYDKIELIASENYVSPAVMAAQGSVMTNKYAEGYAGHRYYGGCENVDVVEQLAIHRLKQLFGCQFANVQPHSGSQANQAVFLALLNPGDTFLGLSLNHGGHLTHGSHVNLSGKWFKAASYTVDPNTHVIDYDQVQALAEEHKPKLIIAGGSAYPRSIDFARFRQISDSVGAYLLVDMAHFAGLAAAGAYPNPVPHAHVVTSTTHKTLRGPRGGIILTNDEGIAKKINSSVFPGLQGGPLMHVIAGKAVAFGEALLPSFKDYAYQTIANTKAMGRALTDEGFSLISGGTDSHLILVDLQSFKLSGKDAEKVLDHANMTCNKNGIPNDPMPPTITSGIRLGAAACTTRGFKETEFAQVGGLIARTLKAFAGGYVDSVMHDVKSEIADLCQKFPIYEKV
ncbi:MAG: serine hydroxymethyltransferase [Candidatus Paracaedibacteraceae bacterium]|nr:serine hydroxymethyltransferase [Candidatus Paracaedibacteraceae bacterium]